VLFAAVGRAILWLLENLFLFFHNVISSQPRSRFDRNFWQDASLSLAIGAPACLWLQSLTA
jgi:hypothetical protein